MWHINIYLFIYDADLWHIGIKTDNAFNIYRNFKQKCVIFFKLLQLNVICKILIVSLGFTSIDNVNPIPESKILFGNAIIRSF